jgi:hypothetical protein
MGDRGAMTGQVRALCMSLACLHGYVMIHIGVCAALQVVIPAHGLSVCVCIRGHVRHVQ